MKYTLAGLSACIAFASTHAFAAPVDVTWKMFRRSEHERNAPRDLPGDAVDVRLKHKWKTHDDFYWLIADVSIPDVIDGKPTGGNPVGIQLSCAAGGDVYVDGALQTRYDNDHPALVLIAEAAEPGRRVRLAIQAYGNLGSEGESEFSQADWVLIDPRRARDVLHVRVDAGRPLGPLPDGIVGLSQGGGMADYDDATAAKLKDAGFRWFRMDNVFTNAVKKGPDGDYVYDFTDLERRVAFMRRVGADPILCASYMPEAFDAVPDPERHSAPKDYKLWEELCFRAARHLIDAGLRVTWWEVWNEVNAGWIKPGPNDTGAPEYARIYEAALGRPAESKDDVRLLEAYLKLYAATAAGIRRADPEARIGGPCLASGPFERSPDRNYAVRGKAFARGLMIFCRERNLPLDFISWHEYFHPADIIAEEARTFRRYLDEFPALRDRVRMFMLTEWNFSWWPDRPQDHEMGAAWCADGLIRAILPERIHRPCFFYVKDNDSNLRGSFALIIRENVPKPAYNMAKMFNRLRGRQLAVTGTDDEICALAAFDAKAARLHVIVVSFNYRYATPRKVRLTIAPLPEPLRTARWRRFLIDPTHSNVWHDRSRAELETADTGRANGEALSFDMTLLPHSVTMIEIDDAYSTGTRTRNP